MVRARALDDTPCINAGTTVPLERLVRSLPHNVIHLDKTTRDQDNIYWLREMAFGSTVLPEEYRRLKIEFLDEHFGTPLNIGGFAPDEGPSPQPSAEEFAAKLIQSTYRASILRRYLKFKRLMGYSYWMPPCF